jgi:CheY-like chemotaxis protein
MPGVLICASEPVARELEGSAVCRNGLQKHVAGTAEAGMTTALQVKPQLVVVDRDLGRAELLISNLRNRAETRSLSIVVVARGDMITEELGLISAGANAVLRLPPDPEWDERIERLMKVPTRKETRVPVSLTFEARFRTERVPGRVLNLSLTGMLVECTAELRVGGEVHFLFEMAGFETSAGEIEGSGRVVRQAGRNRFGVAFTKIDDVGRDMLRRFLLVP